MLFAAWPRETPLVSVNPQDDGDQPGEQHYETLFMAMSEGFALCEAIRDKRGLLVDYTILEINPALQRMLGVGPEAAGSRLLQGPVDPRWLKVCQRVMASGEPESFEFHNPRTELWHEIRVSRVGEDRLAQFFFDITERKRALTRQAELFDELNHRVKNNLAMVSSLLQMQARSAAPAEREGLLKAVDRLQSVSAVHESLYTGHHTETIDLSTYLTNLCERLSESLLEADRVRLEVRTEPVIISVDQAAPIGMIVNELVTNAAKYAYPDGMGTIQVTLERSGEGALLMVSDSGPGLPNDWESRSGSLGMRVVTSLAKQIGGTLDVEGTNGARFSVRFSIPPVRSKAA